MGFAFDRIPPSPRKYFWLGLIVVFGILALPIAIFNLSVDPFDFRLTSHLSLFREQIVRRDDAVLWSIAEIRRIPLSVLERVTVVISGDSRSEMIAGGRGFPRAFKIGEDYILSLAVGGASFDESISIIDTELSRLPKLRFVLLAIPLERIGTQEGNRVPAALKFSRFPLLYGLSLGTLAEAAEVLHEQKNVQLSGVPDVKRDNVDPSNLKDVTSEWLDLPRQERKILSYAEAKPATREKRVIEQWTKKLKTPDNKLIEKRLKKTIEPFVQKLRERGVTTIFFFPPLHPKVLGALENSDIDRHAAYVTSLRKFGLIEDFSRNSGQIPVKFLDGSHPIPETARSIFADIYLRRMKRNSK